MSFYAKRSVHTHRPSDVYSCHGDFYVAFTADFTQHFIAKNVVDIVFKFMER